jgi:multidrug efflux pump subunit AcrA (membrane-fusion protein)
MKLFGRSVRNMMRSLFFLLYRAFAADLANCLNNLLRVWERRIPKMRKLLYCAAAIMIMTTLTACTEKDTEETKEIRVAAVEVAEAKEGGLTIHRSVYGRTSPNISSPVMLQTGGEVDSLEVANGDEVEEDDIIARISTPAGKQTVRAPKDGEVANLNVSEGDMVSNEEPFAIVADLESMKLDFSVTASVRSLFSIDDQLPVIINGKEYEATITRISTMPDDTGLYPVKATVENEEGEILPGMVAELSAPEQQIEKGILVPTAAIVEESDESYVYIVEDEKAVKQPVTILAAQSAETAVEGGIKKGDQLVVTGQLTLSDGAPVNVVKGE